MSERKLTKKLQTSLCNALAAGLPMQIAVNFVGVHKRTVYRWIQRGQQEDEGTYHDFVLAIEAALAKVQEKYLNIILAAAEKNWTAAAWYLERRWPMHWGKYRQVDKPAAGNAPMPPLKAADEKENDE